jgi:hypothetical protein
MEKMLCPTSKSITTQHERRRVCLGWRLRSFTAGRQLLTPNRFSINLQAVPSFEAFGRFLQTANPFAFWAQAAQMAWFPWLGAASALMFPWTVASAPPKLSPGNTESGMQERPRA